MAEYAVTFDVVRVTLVVGVVLSMIVYERTHLTTGGAIVPAYLALSLVRPLAVVVTIGFGYLTHLVVTKVVAPRRIIYGRRRFEVEVLVGVALILIGTAVAARAGTLDPHLAALSGIGFLVPGIIAHDMAGSGLAARRWPSSRRLSCWRPLCGPIPDSSNSSPAPARPPRSRSRQSWATRASCCC